MLLRFDDPIGDACGLWGWDGRDGEASLFTVDCDGNGTDDLGPVAVTIPWRGVSAAVVDGVVRLEEQRAVVVASELQQSVAGGYSGLDITMYSHRSVRRSIRAKPLDW